MLGKDILTAWFFRSKEFHGWLKFWTHLNQNCESCHWWLGRETFLISWSKSPPQFRWNATHPPHGVHSCHQPDLQKYSPKWNNLILRRFKSDPLEHSVLSLLKRHWQFVLWDYFTSLPTFKQYNFADQLVCGRRYFSDDLNSIPGIQIVERENWLLQVVLWSPHVWWHTPTHTHIHTILCAHAHIQNE